MSPPGHKLSDAEGALLHEIAVLARGDGPEVPIKDLELRLEDRGFTDLQTRRALMSLLRRGQVSLSGAIRPVAHTAQRLKEAEKLGFSQAVLPAVATVRPGRRLAMVIGVLALLGAGAGLSRHAWTAPSGKPITVRLLQGNVAQDMKFERAGIDHAMTLYRDMIVAAPADFIMTPETAFPVLLQGIPPDIATSIREFADRTGSHVALGAVGATLTDRGPTDLTNSLFGVTPRDRTLYRYDKHHLVPFGEFVPWGFRWFVDMMHIPLGDFLRGTATPAGFVVRDQRVAFDICYEDLFGEEIAQTLRSMPEPATVLANSTNLAWFGDTIALDQHLQIARMRSLETGRPMLRATNTGTTAIIDAQGRVQARLPAMTTGVLTGTVQPYAGLTPYIRFGNAPALLLALAALGLGLLMTRRAR